MVSSSSSYWRLPKGFYLPAQYSQISWHRIAFHNFAKRLLKKQALPHPPYPYSSSTLLLNAFLQLSLQNKSATIFYINYPGWTVDTITLFLSNRCYFVIRQTSLGRENHSKLFVGLTIPQFSHQKNEKRKIWKMSRHFPQRGQNRPI